MTNALATLDKGAPAQAGSPEHAEVPLIELSGPPTEEHSRTH
jgi:hypothetical protein